MEPVETRPVTLSCPECGGEVEIKYEGTSLKEYIYKKCGYKGVKFKNEE